MASILNSFCTKHCISFFLMGNIAFCCTKTTAKTRVSIFYTTYSVLIMRDGVKLFSPILLKVKNICFLGWLSCDRPQFPPLLIGTFICSYLLLGFLSNCRASISYILCPHLHVHSKHATSSVHIVTSEMIFLNQQKEMRKKEMQ